MKLHLYPSAPRQTANFQFHNPLVKPDNLKNKKIRTRSQLGTGSDFSCVVDDNGLEPLTLRTSSACSTS